MRGCNERMCYLAMALQRSINSCLQAFAISSSTFLSPDSLIGASPCPCANTGAGLSGTDPCPSPPVPSPCPFELDSLVEAPPRIPMPPPTLPLPPPVNRLATLLLPKLMRLLLLPLMSVFFRTTTELVRGAPIIRGSVRGRARVGRTESFRRVDPTRIQSCSGRIKWSKMVLSGVN